MQARHTSAHHESLGRAHCARGGHHHGKGAVKFGGGVDDALVAGEIGLARKNIHHLRAGDARHKFHGDGGDAGLGERGQFDVIAIGVERADDQCALGDTGQRCRCGPPHGEYDLGVFEGGRSCCRDGGAGGGILGIENACTQTCPLLDGNGSTEGDQFADGFGGGRDAVFSREAFTHDSNFHQKNSCPPVSGQAR